MDKAMGRAATATGCMKRASGHGTGVTGEGAEKIESPMVPDSFEGIGQDISEQEIIAPEKQVAGIY